MAKRQTRGQGFSLYDMRDSISKAVDDLSDALQRQGVDVNVDNLLLQIQGVVNSVGNPANVYSGGTGMYASDDKQPVPYSVAGDLMAIGYQYYKAGDKKEAIKNCLMAMASDDYSEIVSGLLSMNAQADMDDGNTPTPEDEDEDEDETEDTDEDDNENEDDTSEESDDLSEEEIQALIDEDDTETPTEDEDDTTKVEADEGTVEATPEKAKPTIPAPATEKPAAPKTPDEEDEETEDDETEEKPNKTPMGKTSSEMNASMNRKIMANRVSLSGTPATRDKAREFIKSNKPI